MSIVARHEKYPSGRFSFFFFLLSTKLSLTLRDKGTCAGWNGKTRRMIVHPNVRSLFPKSPLSRASLLPGFEYSTRASPSVTFGRDPWIRCRVDGGFVKNTREEVKTVLLSPLPSSDTLMRAFQPCCDLQQLPGFKKYTGKCITLSCIRVLLEFIRKVDKCAASFRNNLSSWVDIAKVFPRDVPSCIEYPTQKEDQKAEFFNIRCLDVLRTKEMLFNFLETFIFYLSF